MGDTLRPGPRENAEGKLLVILSAYGAYRHEHTAEHWRVQGFHAGPHSDDLLPGSSGRAMTTGTRGRGWSAGIIGAFAVFMAVMIVMIVISMRSTVDLVEEGYYEEGLAYERHIEAVRNARAEGDVAVTAGASGIRLAFPRGGRCRDQGRGDALQAFGPGAGPARGPFPGQRRGSAHSGVGAPAGPLESEGPLVHAGG